MQQGITNTRRLTDMTKTKAAGQAQAAREWPDPALSPGMNVLELVRERPNAFELMDEAGLDESWFAALDRVTSVIDTLDDARVVVKVPTFVEFEVDVLTGKIKRAVLDWSKWGSDIHHVIEVDGFHLDVGSSEATVDYVRRRFQDQVDSVQALGQLYFSWD